MERFAHSDARSKAVLRTLNRVNSRPGWCDPYIYIYIYIYSMGGSGGGPRENPMSLSSPRAEILS